MATRSDRLVVDQIVDCFFDANRVDSLTEEQ